MRILAIETTTKNLGIAIADENSVLAEYKGDAILAHAQDLIPNMDKLLKKTRLGLSDIDCLAISIGPGSFTGLRVGVSMLKGLNLATKIPIVSVPTLEVIAHNALRPSTFDLRPKICVIVDAKKKNVYSCLYKIENHGIIKSSDYLLLSPEELIERIQRREATDERSVERRASSVERVTKDNSTSYVPRPTFHVPREGEVLFLGDGISLYGSLITEKLPGARLAGKEYWYPDVKVVAALGVEKFRNKEFTDPDALTPMYIYSGECSIRGVMR